MSNDEFLRHSRQLLMLFAAGFLLFVVSALNNPACCQPLHCIESEIRALPGGLDKCEVFSSNSPELVLSDGVLLSTFPPDAMKNPRAHLNHAFSGSFDIFAHHVTRNENPQDRRTLFLAFIIGNRSKKAVNLTVLSAASYLSQPDAPFIEMPAKQENGSGEIYAGPGDRVASEILQNKRAGFLPEKLSLAPGKSRLFFCLPLPVQGLSPPLNGRSTLVKLKSDGPVHLALLAIFKKDESEKCIEAECIEALNNLDLAQPRDKAPSPPDQKDKIIYGRVSGVSIGSTWNSLICDHDQSKDCKLTIPEPGKAYSYPIASVAGGSFGTGQVQSAGLLLRYPDTAYAAHGNYGVKYSIKIPAYNSGTEEALLQLFLQSPIKSDIENKKLCFYDDLKPRASFRGTVLFSDGKKKQYLHLVEKAGDEGQMIAEINMPPGARRELSLEFIYPPDATPVQVLTVRTAGRN